MNRQLTVLILKIIRAIIKQLTPEEINAELVKLILYLRLFKIGQMSLNIAIHP